MVKTNISILPSQELATPLQSVTGRNKAVYNRKNCHAFRMPRTKTNLVKKFNILSMHGRKEYGASKKNC